MEFDRDTFANVAGSSFRLTADDGASVDVVLSDVSELREKSRQRSFSMVFTVPEGYEVGQGLYDVQHESLGALQIFLVPIGTRKGLQELEAVFNFLVDEE